ncbi:MAG: Helix-turn-helix domain protein [Methanosaeta sp. PtaU1.Bin028]|nr:MAG: Helix-turn-helix domain protein [Methanosaeta sp. PtaU1.Bin028]
MNRNLTYALNHLHYICIKDIVLKASKFRLYPTKSQIATMERTQDVCRWTYNQTPTYRKNAWEKEGKSISKYEMHNYLPR